MIEIEIERDILEARRCVAKRKGYEQRSLLLFCIPILSFFFFSFTSAISGHMGTPNVIGRERAERKSSAYNRLDEI